MFKSFFWGRKKVAFLQILSTGCLSLSCLEEVIGIALQKINEARIHAFKCKKEMKIQLNTQL